MKKSLPLSLFALACFIASMLLPVVRVMVLDAAIAPGWKAIEWLGLIVIDLVSHLGTADLSLKEEIQSVVIGLAGFLNIAFIIVSAMLMRGTLTGKPWHVLNGISMSGFILALAVPLSLYPTYSCQDMRAGYFVWLAGYIVLLMALFLARKEAGKRALAQKIRP